MCRRRHLLPGLVLALLTGCATGHVARSAGGDHAAAQTPIGPDGVVLDVALLECRVGDRCWEYLTGELWDSADEQAVPQDNKLVLEDNGFRVGHLVGAAPGRLQTLLTTERCCVSRWRQILPAGKSVTLAVGRPVPEMRPPAGREPEEVLERAQSYLVTVPALTADGGTRLRFTPQIQYGETLPEYRAAPDLSGWVLSYRRRQKSYPEVGWEVTLAPNEYLLIGAAPDNPQSLGHQCFVQEAGGDAVQRLLVIRTARAAPELPAQPLAGTPEEVAGGATPPPLALQATWTTARGIRP